MRFALRYRSLERRNTGVASGPAMARALRWLRSKQPLRLTHRVRRPEAPH
jgi:hypothetical protein